MNTNYMMYFDFRDQIPYSQSFLRLCGYQPHFEKVKKGKVLRKSYLFIKKSVVNKMTLHKNVPAGWCPLCTAADDAVIPLVTFTAAVQLEFLISLSAC